MSKCSLNSFLMVSMCLSFVQCFEVFPEASEGQRGVTTKELLL